MTFRELYQIAKEALEQLSPLEDADFRLEQAEYSSRNEVWEVIVSYLVENVNKPVTPLGVLGSGYKFQRIYKRVSINDKKEVIGFYIYEKNDNN